MLYPLENRGNHPIYEYLYNCIKNDILTGKIKPGEKLPSKREMAKSHGISVITVENAYGQLVTEGYIYSQEKKGFFAGDLGGKYMKTAPKRVRVEQEESTQWLVDFKSNHILYDGFPFSTWTKVMRKTLLDRETTFLESPQPDGVAPLRQAIAMHLEKYRGMNVNPNHIVIGAGTEYLYSLIVQLLGHSSMIGIEDPGHKKVGKIYESHGIKCLHINVDANGLVVEDLEGANVSAVHISPSHHFPTGCVMPAARRYKLLQWAKENDTYIIEDDYDSEFRFQGRPIQAMVGMDESQVIYMNTFSKTLAPSIRIAYMILPEALMKKFHEQFGFYSGTVSGFEQYTLANFILQGYFERHINRMRNYYREYRGHILSAIQHSPFYDKVTVEEANAGLHFILKINRDIDDEKYVEMLKKKHINISTVAEYCYHNQEQFQHQLIINYSDVKEEDLKEALKIMNDTLEESMNAYQGDPSFQIEIPKNVATILKILESRGYEAFAVGGCVRDTILGRTPGDWDITTSALPQQVKKIFHKTIDTGLQHGTVTVRIGGEGYEVTTYRIDGKYTDGRHPDQVQYTTDLIEDLKRRDFTVNAMAYNPSVGLIDAFDGMGDLERKRITCVGDAKERFCEDALRILRAVRFSAQLGFEIAEPTKEAIVSLAPMLKKISAERIRTELEKLLLSDHPEKLVDAYEMGITNVVLPEFDRMMECTQRTPYHQYDVGRHTIEVVRNVPADRVMRWAALLHDVAKPESRTVKDGREHFHGHAHLGSRKAPEIMRRLRIDNKTIKTVARLIDCHDDRPAQTPLGATPEAVRRSVHKIGKDIYAQYLMLAYADFQGKSDYGKEKGFDDYLYVCRQFEEILQNHICTSVKEMNISGKDLIALGCPTGEKIGEVLEELLELVLKDPDKNKKEILQKEAEKMITAKGRP